MKEIILFSAIFIVLMGFVLMVFRGARLHDIRTQILGMDLFQLQSEEEQVYYRIDSGYGRPNDRFRLHHIRRAINARLRS